jgi:hypothetical protein
MRTWRTRQSKPAHPSVNPLLGLLSVFGSSMIRGTSPNGPSMPDATEDLEKSKASNQQVILQRREDNLKAMHDNFLQQAESARQIGDLRAEMGARAKAETAGRSLQGVTDLLGRYMESQAGITKAKIVTQGGITKAKIGAGASANRSEQQAMARLQSSLVSQGYDPLDPEVALSIVRGQAAPAGDLSPVAAPPNRKETTVSASDFSSNVQKGLESYKKNKDLPTLSQSFLQQPPSDWSYLRWKRWILNTQKPGNPFMPLGGGGKPWLTPEQIKQAAHTYFTDEEIQQGEDQEKQIKARAPRK